MKITPNRIREIRTAVTDIKSDSPELRMFEDLLTYIDQQAAKLARANRRIEQQEDESDEYAHLTHY